MRAPTDSQTQFLQIVCVVLVMATLIGLVAGYFLYREVVGLEDQVREAKANIDSLKNRQTQLVTNLETLKQLSGYPLSEVGEPDGLESGTITGQARQQMSRLLGPDAEGNFRDAMVTLHSRWQDALKERDVLKTRLDKIMAAPRGN